MEYLLEPIEVGTDIEGSIESFGFGCHDGNCGCSC